MLPGSHEGRYEGASAAPFPFDGSLGGRAAVLSGCGGRSYPAALQADMKVCARQRPSSPSGGSGGRAPHSLLLMMSTMTTGGG